MKPVSLVCLALLLTACGMPQSATPGPTPQAITLLFPAALQPWADKLSSCADSDPLVGLYFMQLPGPKSSLQANEIMLELGDPPPPADALYLSQVGWEQLAVVVNQGNELAQLTSAELRAIFSGQTLKWDAGTGKVIQVWVLPDGDPIRRIFDQAVLPSKLLAPEARLAPDPNAMLEAISKDIAAIGYLPESIITISEPDQLAKVKIIPLDEKLSAEFHLPVIAATGSEPQGLMRELVACLTANQP
jgi:hypothetical protein